MPLEPLHGKERENNDIKRITTKSGNRLVMDDKDGKETIVMATPKHVRVSLFDGGSTLVLHSDGDIHINAGGTVHMKCSKFLREVG
jgi:type VI secretion system secreted protein VgrG